jgi:hypothetical protein
VTIANDRKIAAEFTVQLLGKIRYNALR